MYYLFLILAIGAEIFSTTMLKSWNESQNKLYLVLCIAGYFFCYYMFGRSIKGINLGVGYAIWCSVGMVMTSIISLIVFHEPLTVWGWVGVGFIVFGVSILSIFGTK